MCGGAETKRKSTAGGGFAKWALEWWIEKKSGSRDV